MIERRQFLRGLIAAPAIIKLAPLMKIKPQPLIIPEPIVIRTALPWKSWRMMYQGVPYRDFDVVSLFIEANEIFDQVGFSEKYSADFDK